MTRPYLISFRERAVAQIQRERTWLRNHRGPEHADAFEEELRHALELIAQFPEMGDASPKSPSHRHWYLRRSGFHVYYVVEHEHAEVRVMRIRHEKQRPLKRWS